MQIMWTIRDADGYLVERFPYAEYMPALYSLQEWIKEMPKAGFLMHKETIMADDDPRGV